MKSTSPSQSGSLFPASTRCVQQCVGRARIIATRKLGKKIVTSLNKKENWEKIISFGLRTRGKSKPGLRKVDVVYSDHDKARKRECMRLGTL